MDYFQLISQIRPQSTLDILWIAKESFILVDSFLLIAQFISQSEWLFCESSLFNESIKSISKTADCKKFSNCTLINCRIDSQSGLNESFCDFQKNRSFFDSFHRGGQNGSQTALNGCFGICQRIGKNYNNCLVNRSGHEAFRKNILWIAKWLFMLVDYFQWIAQIGSHGLSMFCESQKNHSF